MLDCLCSVQMVSGVLQASGCELEAQEVLQILEGLASKLWPPQPAVKPQPEPSTPSERLSLASRHRHASPINSTCHC